MIMENKMSIILSQSLTIIVIGVGLFDCLSWLFPFISGNIKVQLGLQLKRSVIVAQPNYKDKWFFSD